ncbi:hypothetical protein MSKOL_1694 [Methanosarcina sp. Kolksee]|uniref:DUF4062 domain-containing protein n=1 Tax=Methanosarcina sp. Kolksee TaxID=1434099 RepID=UPI000615515C|nr:DUF4062 domain-containing protein [Methanosarcina sp. Kolksee]AKB47471.1 hypothetical protein MSKOL_1694 [Methanosarcina sp. Kolksee]
MARVFVSSTFKDLEECREKVRIVLKRMGHEDVAMEYFVAEDKRPVDKCMESVSTCDLYIGIFAWRYGYVPDGYDKSLTELEYRKAVETGKDCLIFLLDEHAPWPPKFVDREINAYHIAALRNELSNEIMVSFFKSADELSSLVGAAVHNWEIHLKKDQVADRPDFILNSEIYKETDNVFSRERGGEIIGWEGKNKQYIKELKESYDKNGLVLFLGAGVSSSAGMPDWGTLISKLITDLISKELSNGLEASEDEIQIIADELQKINSFSPLVEARYLRASFTDEFEKKISDNLYREINKDEITTSKLLNSIIKLCMPKRTGPGVKAIVNYNFDDLIETYLQEISVKCCPVCTNSYFVSPEQLAIYHVHGFLPRKEDDYKGIPKGLIVFSEEGYHNLIQDAYYWSNIIQLNCFLENTCLMIGLSVTDPNLRRLLDVAAKNNSMPKHYVLLKRLSLSEVLDRHKEKKFRENIVEAFISMHHKSQEASFQQLGLNVIWYESHDDIPGIIDKIRN